MISPSLYEKTGFNTFQSWINFSNVRFFSIFVEQVAVYVHDIFQF
jgi:hypothetical protein